MSDCDKLLENGLYSFTKMTDGGSFKKDLRTYYLSETFKSDMKSGKWGNSATIPINGVPFTFGMDFSEEKYQEFRTKLLETEEINISSDFYKTFYQSIPNTNLYQAYLECKRINSDVDKVGLIQGPIFETQDTVVFTFYYRPQAPGDPSPKVQSLTVQPEGSILKGILTPGNELDYTTTITCRRDDDKDLIISLDTDRGSVVSKSVAEGSLSSDSNLPIGTVITSFLKLDQFYLATKSNEKSGGIWTALKSRWAPCDGRSVVNSKFNKISSQTNVPDLRGLFLRGLNSFDAEYTVAPQNMNQLNPEVQPLGVFQSDALANHKHTLTSSTNVLHYTEGVGLKGGDGSTFMSAINNYLKGGGALLTTDNDGGSAAETRSKNVSVYYYIKIN